jgi:hypothetical protein
MGPSGVSRADRLRTAGAFVRRNLMRIFVRRSPNALIAIAGLLGLAAPVAGCGQSDEPYKPMPAFSGRKATLPPVPTLPNKPIKVGDVYTVFGATHHLRSRVHNPEVNGKDITIAGYIVKTNLPDAPPCAVHKTGKGDKEDCKSPVPAFWIADDKGDDKNAIKVMGWASNFSQIYDAIAKTGKNYKKGETPKDEFWAVDIPDPIPNVDAKVQVTGNFAVSFTKATSGVETDPQHGIVTYAKLSYVEPPPQPGILPGMPGAKKK